MTGSSGPIRIEPLAVAHPEDVEDLSVLVAWAGAEGVSLFARGAGTGMPGGNVGSGVCVDLSDWTAMDAVDPERRQVTVQAGVVASELDDAAGEHGLFLPPLPSSAGRCTLGGMVASNAAGARTFGYGAAHRWVEAVEVVLADGSSMTLERAGRMPDAVGHAHRAAAESIGDSLGAWPDVRKNSSGYALDRFLPSADPVDLFVGSEGTLGFITSARLRLAPLPPSRALTLFPVPGLDTLHDAIMAADAADASACEFFAHRFLDVGGLRRDAELGPLLGSAQAALLVELEGTEEQVETGLAALRDFTRGLGVRSFEARGPVACARLWEVRHAASPVVAARATEGLVSMQFIEDSVVHPGRLRDYLVGLEEILTREETDAVMFGHAGDGNVHVNPLVDVRRPDWRLRVGRILVATADLVSGLKGTLSGEHGDGRIRAHFHERIFGAPTAAAFRAVKHALDPVGILSPGVVVALPGQDPLDGLSPEPRRT